MAKLLSLNGTVELDGADATAGLRGAGKIGVPDGWAGWLVTFIKLLEVAELVE